FTAPRDRLMGRMSLVVRGGPNGAGAVTVEEYKRPKFEVKIEPPKDSPKLLAKVSVIGKATAYTGAAIGGAKVKYRVVREVRYPYWWGYRYWWRPRAQTQEIAHGSATTKGDGSFTVEFVAKPDLTVTEKDEPTFSYQINADVTDTTGETRSGNVSINIGYTALAATLSAGSWLTSDKPVELAIRTNTLNGQPEAAKGNVKIYRLKEPAKVQRAELGGGYRPPVWRRGRIVAPAPDPGNVSSWELGEVVLDNDFTTDATGAAKLEAKLAVGVYRAVLESRDRFGKKVTAEAPLQVINPAANKLGIKLPNLVAGETWTLEPGQELNAIWGSGYDKAQAFIEVEHRRKVLQAYWTKPGITQTKIAQAVTEAMRGGFTVRVSMVRENRAYLSNNRVNVPWTNKNLKVKWEHFVSKLEPGDKETWTATITGPDAKKAVAEMVATLYDESLDQYLPHNWMSGFNVFRQDSSNLSSQFQNFIASLNYIHGQWPQSYKQVSISYRDFPADVMANLWGYGYFGKGRMKNMMRETATRRARGDANSDRTETEKSEGSNRKALQQNGVQKQATSGSGAAGPDLSKVSARTNLAETAFFFPQLISTDDGEVKLEFTMPETLTRWKFLGFVHDKQLRGGLLQDSVVTAKELMIEPNPPRFVREGDELEFTVKVTNQSAGRQTGTVRLSFADARTTNPRDTQLGNKTTDLKFDVASKSSESFAWRIKVPDGMEFLTYKAVGSTGRLSDGEQGYLPVLSRRILVTESLPLPIRGAQTKKFDFTRLQASKDSKTIKHQSVTVQMVSNPSWYAVMALPYLMEFPHQCTEQTFNRLYANALARHIANSDPKIRRVFDQWKGTPALDSPLEKNQDLKAVMLEETPWYRQAKKESAARRNVGILFDANRLNEETRALLKKIAEMQYPDGAWPWFPGGRANDYITLYITTGFGRMRHLGVDIDTAAAVKSLARLDGWIKTRYDYIVAHNLKDKNNLSTTIALYLYGRSFFLKDKAIAPEHKEAVDFFLAQARKYWLQLANRQSQGHLALALKRFGDQATPQGIMASIKERSVSDEELGMFWRETERSWWWYRAPIETQAVMIEAFDEVMNDKVAVEDCKVWLLKQKQTQDWKTTKATADAVYALLLRGTNLLASDELVQVELGGETIDPMKVEAGTGFYEQRFIRAEVKSTLGDITVKKVDEGVAWGSVHWQYLEDIGNVTAHDGTPLKLTKQLYIKSYTKKGPVLTRVAGPVAVGDELVVRIVLRTDRDMEYVHMKDHRGSGTEPVNVLSKYHYQDGLGYYESTRDTASHFYIDYLPKGTYVFEYSTRVVHRGSYQTGLTHIQCMYAPEFNSHSESLGIVVK
ncbi:MAG: hypothetical protein O3A00_15095, partial [Planctomycetota bacterium]|nr:hypothetical protein [Planctomycetota bacterium]